MEAELLIPGLPDDVAYNCLARAASFQHSPAVRRVCRRWRREVDSAELRRIRESSGLARPILVLAQAEPRLASDDSTGKHAAAAAVAGPYQLVAFDPNSSAWAPLPPPPRRGGLPMFCGLANTARELVVVGGWDTETWAASDEVFVYSFASGEWRRCAPLPGPQRSLFACAAAGAGTVVVAGGHDEEKNALRSAAAYDVGRDVWTLLPDMDTERDECRAVVPIAGGRLVRVEGGYATEAQGRFHTSSETFDLTTGAWGAVEEISDVDVGREAEQVVAEGDEWRGEVPENATVGTKSAALGDKLFVVGSASHGGDMAAYILDATSPAMGKKGGEWTAVDVPPEYSGHLQALCCFHI